MQPSSKEWREAEQSGVIDFATWETETEQPWPDIIPFDASTDTSEFPLDVFPGPVAEFCKSECRSLCVSPGMVGPLVLAMLSTTFQQRYRIKPKGSDNDWTEPLNLFVIVSAPPSAGKSPSFTAIQRPLVEWERERREEKAPTIEAERAERRMLEQRQAHCEKRAAAGGKEAETDRLEALAIAEQLAAKPEPAEPILFVGDCTEEALFDIMRRQDGAVTIASAEGGILINLNGRYKSLPDLDIYLKSFSGEGIDSHRIGRGSFKLYDARLSIMLCCQPDVLEEFVGNKTFAQRGLTARFLYARPKPVKTTSSRIQTGPVPAEIIDRYHQFVRGKMDGTGAGEIFLRGDALEEYYRAVDAIEMTEEDRSDFSASWYGKYRGQLARIIGLLHCAWTENPVAEPVEIGVVLCAVQVMDYFVQQFDALTQTVGATQAEQDALYLLGKLEGTTEITRRDLHQMCRRRIKKSSDMDAPLQELEERGYIRITENRNTGGRKSTVIEVNPQWCTQTQKTQKTQK